MNHTQIQQRAIRDSIRNALTIASTRGYNSIAFPLIGAGTGGFSPDRSLAIMEEEARSTDYRGRIEFVIFRPLRSLD